MQPSLISQLKTIRQMAIMRLTEFFESMADYDFKPICDALFSSAVWPQVVFILLQVRSHHDNFAPSRQFRPITTISPHQIQHVHSHLYRPNYFNSFLHDKACSFSDEEKSILSKCELIVKLWESSMNMQI